MKLEFFGFADAKALAPIHREAPLFVEQSTEQEILTTGIKVQPQQLLFDPVAQTECQPTLTPWH